MRKIVIIGYGRFGQLLANILKPFGKIFIIDEKKANLHKGLKQIEFHEIGLADWIFLAVPISSLEKVLLNIKSLVKPGAVVMDVCSVKVYPCKLLKKHMPKEVEILGTHPMFGPDSAKQGLNGLQMVFCPLRISKIKLKEVLDVFKQLQLKIIETFPEDHDRQGAFNLSLVHFLGRGLEKIGMQSQQISTMGYQKLLSVSESVKNDTWQLFFDMQRYNPYAKKIRNDFAKALIRLNNEINKKKNV